VRATYTPDEIKALRVMYDRTRYLTESGNFAEAVVVAEQFLESVPNVVPVLNNLSMAHFMQGDVAQAIAVAGRCFGAGRGKFPRPE
jgi:Flp pilus assembly protein TadD